jgi:hypothetical protein
MKSITRIIIRVTVLDLQRILEWDGCVSRETEEEKVKQRKSEGDKLWKNIIMEENYGTI